MLPPSTTLLLARILCGIFLAFSIGCISYGAVRMVSVDKDDEAERTIDKFAIVSGLILLPGAVYVSSFIFPLSE